MAGRGGALKGLRAAPAGAGGCSAPTPAAGRRRPVPAANFSVLTWKNMTMGLVFFISRVQPRGTSSHACSRVPSADVSHTSCGGACNASGHVAMCMGAGAARGRARAPGGAC